jgi:hypothetical protein
MPSASVRLLAARFSVTETTERRRSLSLRPTSLAHRNSLVEAGSVPSLAPRCDFGDPQVGRKSDFVPFDPSARVAIISK